ncbi:MULTISPECIES: MCE family protein [unclassified Nocardioides]|uniref:MCE family protein n=1 Tax=unclassified Nocardioides TaxID=2615069 RepID=UPI0006F41517|nr:MULTISPECIES: MCE family protein [unclassified Nocardioides]KRA31084.1 hypothetical protein ASD81_16495 [Nocardioides sp. Root614]KRA87704.1 hypothetical protein ASD84_16765 [Nocardioides sp. Root682]
MGRKIAIILMCLATVGVGFALLSDTASGRKHGVAYFDSFTNVYQSDKVRILGVEVGTIDKVVAERDRVRVEFSYDGDYSLPADVQAAIVSPTLVATRFIQLSPAYIDGPTLSEGGEIPLERTASPLEYDDLKSEVSEISKALGPGAKGQKGVLADLVAVGADLGEGQGKNFNTMITDLSAALSTLAEGRGDIFGTVRNLQIFISAVAQMDGDVAQFNRRLAGVADLLETNGDDLNRAFTSVDRAARLVRRFVKQNRPGIADATDQLAELMTTLANSRDDLATLLHVGPNTLTNFYNIISPRMQTLTGGLMLDNLGTPGQLACAFVSAQLAQQQAADTTCNETLGPLLDKFGIYNLPVGTGGPLQFPGGGAPYLNDKAPDKTAGTPASGAPSDEAPAPPVSGLESLLLPLLSGSSR